MPRVFNDDDHEKTTDTHFLNILLTTVKRTLITGVSSSSGKLSFNHTFPIN